ncbi:MAG TPA: protoporphyrinogen oxidase HemJ [Paracoccaceae bacterium]|nr:protoporphyrinogen oxidase HemJ [Paracoccaceae bacterium]
MGELLALLYPWVKALHVAAVIAWMAALFYLPRLFAYHAERGAPGSELSETFKLMERRLLRVIMNPAMIAVWLLGLMLAFTPGIVDWRGDRWFQVKLVLVIGLTWYHHLLARWRKAFAAESNRRPARFYRLMNEVPTLIMLGIVVMVIVRPF